MPRNRQFSAQRTDLAKSNLSQSRNNLASSRMNNSRIQKYQIATPTSNKHPSNSSNNKLSSSRLSRKSSSSDYICVGCFNDNLASDKKKQRREELLKQKQLEKQNNKALINQTHKQIVKYQEHQKEISQLKNYNKHLIEEKKNQKAREKNLQLQYDFQQRKQMQRTQRQERQKLSQQKVEKQKYKTVIKQQIDQKYKKTHQISPFTLKPPMEDIFGRTEEEYFKQKAQKQHLYREELLRQIKARQQAVKKQQIENKRKQNIGIGITEAAYQRQLERQKKLDDRQHQIMEETKRLQKMRQTENKKEHLRQQQQVEKRLREDMNKQQEERKFMLDKQRQTDVYLDDLRHQIQQRKKKKIQEIRQMHAVTNTSMQFEQKHPQRKSCKSCDKKFPKTFLTKIK